MSKNNFPPHLHTHQRNSLSNQIQDGFLIFHKEADQYEQWDSGTRTWIPMLDGNNNREIIQTSEGNNNNNNIDDYDHFIFNSLSQTVTEQDVLDDWSSI